MGKKYMYIIGNMDYLVEGINSKLLQIIVYTKKTGYLNEN